MNALGELRASLGVTQIDLARRLDVAVVVVDQIELTPLGEVALSDVERFVSALGGRMDLVVVLDGLSHWLSNADGEWLR